MRPPAALTSLVALVPLLGLIAPTLLSAQRPLSLLDRRVDSVFTAFNHTSTPGCAVGVDRGGKALVRRAYGMANLESGTPFTLGTISESGSTAKQFVASALVMLALDGVLTLDDDVSKWVPEVKGLGKRISVRQLLSHTSGIPDRYTLHEVQGRPAGEVDHSNAEVIDIVSRLRDPNFAPGEDYLYSNTGYVVAVAVLERASGKSLQAFTDERIFRPLGMTSTRWREDHRVVVPGRAAAYGGTSATGFSNDHPFTRVFGSGGLLLTIDDFLKWSNAFQTGEGRWGAIRDSLSAVIRLNDGTAITYGLGVTTDEWRGVKRVSHTGSTGGYRAALYRFPQQEVSVALLCNVGSANPGALATGVATIVLGEPLRPIDAEIAPAIAFSPEALSALRGRYHAPFNEDVSILEIRNGQLVDSVSGTPLIPWGPDRFRVRGTQTVLTFTRGASSVAIKRETPGARAVDLVRVEAPVKGAAAIAAYVGRFTSPELGAEFNVVVQGDSLLVDRGWRGTESLTPIFRDGFVLADGKRIRFTRDARGRVAGLLLWDGRVRHLRFERVASR